MNIPTKVRPLVTRDRETKNAFPGKTMTPCRLGSVGEQKGIDISNNPSGPKKFREQLFHGGFIPQHRSANSRVRDPVADLNIV